MGQLRYKTRGDTTPYGKPRVYFCCHPADFDAFFESVSDEILREVDCGIWYPKDPSVARSPEDLEDLARMQLFVMPVTARLLREENPARDAEFAFAMQRHIPVLPLMQEKGLEALFDEKCGDLQTLSPFRTDETGLRYEEKRKRFLQAVLVGDETAKKIRDAFCAGIFLSYRKKDRKNAQDLMKLIHQYDFCRDVAIWYDEFLIPGENFNDAIRAELEKSDLFVMAVTPNLVNEKNYVQENEYPIASENHIPTVPAELVATDRALLEKQYPGIPACTDAYHKEALGEALLAALKEAGPAEKERTPEHNYLIGLAYLSGVGVEVDHPQAKALITDAARAGVAEAVDKLVEMYHKGLGVARDYRQALVWQEEKIRRLEAEYQAKPEAQTLHRLYGAIDFCGDCCEERGQLRDAETYYSQALQKTEGTPYANEDQQVCRDVAIGWAKLARIRLNQGDIAGARQYAEKARERFSLAAERPGKLELDWEIAAILNFLGEVCQAEGDLRGARKNYEESLRKRAVLLVGGGLEARSAFAVSCGSIGDLYMEERNAAEAKPFYETALKELQTVVAQTGTAGARRLLAAVHGRLGDVFLEEGNQSEAKDAYEKKLQIWQKLAEETGEPGDQRELRRCFSKMGRLCQKEGDLRSAMTHYTDACRIAEETVHQMEGVHPRRDLASAYGELGEICLESGNPAEALKWMNKMLEVAEALAEEFNLREDRSRLAWAHNCMGNLFWQERMFGQAKVHYEKMQAVTKALEEEASNPEDRRNLVVGHTKLADILWIEGDLAAARAHEEAALELAEALAAETPTLSSRRELAVICRSLGDLCKEMGDLPGTRQHYARSHSVIQALAEEVDTPQIRRDLMLSHKRMCAQYLREKDPAKARPHMEKAMDIGYQDARKTGTAPVMRDLAGLYDAYADLMLAELNFQGVKLCYDQSLTIRKALAERTGTVEDRRNLTFSYDALGNYHLSAKELVEAGGYYEKAVRLAEQIVKEVNTPDSWNDLGSAYCKLAMTVEPETRKRYLEAAVNIFEGLCRQFPGVSRYEYNLRKTKEELSS